MLLECPSQCHCEKISSTILLEIKCQKKNLTSVPQEIQSNVLALDLSRNNIIRLTGNDFNGCNNLEILDISRNELQHIDPHTFNPLVNLKTLNIFNSIKSMMSISFNEIFHKLRHLESIDIRYMFYWSDINLSTYINILHQFPVTLKSLYMNIPANSDFAQFLTNFTELTDLGISARDMMFITHDTFKPFRNIPIRNLVLHFQTLVAIDMMSFSWFPQLESLDLSNSRGTLDLNGLSEAWYGLNNNTKLKSLNLENYGEKYNLGHPFGVFSNI